MGHIFGRILQAMADRMTGPVWLWAIFQPSMGLALMPFVLLRRLAARLAR